MFGPSRHATAAQCRDSLPAPAGTEFCFGPVPAEAHGSRARPRVTDIPHTRPSGACHILQLHGAGLGALFHPQRFRQGKAGEPLAAGWYTAWGGRRPLAAGRYTAGGGRRPLAAGWYTAGGGLRPLAAGRYTAGGGRRPLAAGGQCGRARTDRCSARQVWEHKVWKVGRCAACGSTVYER